MQQIAQGFQLAAEYNEQDFLSAEFFLTKDVFGGVYLAKIERVMKTGEVFSNEVLVMSQTWTKTRPKINQHLIKQLNNIEEKSIKKQSKIKKIDRASIKNQPRINQKSNKNGSSVSIGEV